MNLLQQNKPNLPAPVGYVQGPRGGFAWPLKEETRHSLTHFVAITQ